MQQSFYSPCKMQDDRTISEQQSHLQLRHVTAATADSCVALEVACAHVGALERLSRELCDAALPPDRSYAKCAPSTQPCVTVRPHRRTGHLFIHLHAP